MADMTLGKAANIKKRMCASYITKINDVECCSIYCPFMRFYRCKPMTMPILSNTEQILTDWDKENPIPVKEDKEIILTETEFSTLLSTADSLKDFAFGGHRFPDIKPLTSEQKKAIKADIDALTEITERLYDTKWSEK